MCTRRISIRLTNSMNTALTLHLKPWGDQYVMVAGTTLTTEAQGPDDNLLEVEYGETTITVYGWVGSIVSVKPAD